MRGRLDVVERESAVRQRLVQRRTLVLDGADEGTFTVAVRVLHHPLLKLCCLCSLVYYVAHVGVELVEDLHDDAIAAALEFFARLGAAVLAAK